MEILTGFLLGFLGSFHCIGMCGPLALALPLGTRFVLSRLLYNFGRVFTYGILGLIFGFIGSRLNLSGFQQFTSISLGILIIAVVLAPEKLKVTFLRAIGIERILLVLKKYMSAFYVSNKLTGNFLIGVLNGFLPCGFVYMALSGALIAGSLTGSSLFMLMFGIGTIPAMFTLSAAGRVISLNFRNKIKKYVPALVVFIAVLFILRGLNLGIPFVSPKLVNPVPSIENSDCH